MVTIVSMKRKRINRRHKRNIMKPIAKRSLFKPVKISVVSDERLHRPELSKKRALLMRRALLISQRPKARQGKKPLAGFHSSELKAIRRDVCRKRRIRREVLISKKLSGNGRKRRMSWKSYVSC